MTQKKIKTDIAWPYHRRVFYIGWFYTCLIIFSVCVFGCRIPSPQLHHPVILHHSISRQFSSLPKHHSQHVAAVRWPLNIVGTCWYSKSARRLDKINNIWYLAKCTSNDHRLQWLPVTSLWTFLRKVSFCDLSHHEHQQALNPKSKLLALSHATYSQDASQHLPAPFPQPCPMSPLLFFFRIYTTASSLYLKVSQPGPCSFDGRFVPGVLLPVQEGHSYPEKGGLRKGRSRVDSQNRLHERRGKR